MKIIKMGNKNNYRNVCPYCFCEYEYDNNDIYKNNYYNLTVTEMYVYCPCCGQKNNIYDYNYIKPFNPLYPWQGIPIMVNK